jgi:hypothetical protein
MNSNAGRSLILASFTAGIFLSSCVVITSTTKPAALEISTETLTNGHLIQIRTGHPVGPVTALLAQRRWLVVTIADTALDADGLEVFRSSFIDSVQTTRFSIALQIAFRLTVDADVVDVIHVEPSRDVLISLFTGRNKK